VSVCLCVCVCLTHTYVRTEVKVGVQYEDAKKQSVDGPDVTLRLGSSGSVLFKHGTTRWVCMWLEKLLSPDAIVYDQTDGNPALRDLAVAKMDQCGGIQAVVSAVTRPDDFPGWETMFRALNLLYAVEDPPAAEHVDAVIATVERNYRAEMPSSVAAWRHFMLCLSMLCHAAQPRFDALPMLTCAVEELPAQTFDTCIGIYRHALKQGLHVQLTGLIRNALSEARKLVAFRRQRSEEDHALQRERSAETLTKQRSKLDEKDAKE
jgi:hypothetical protein